MKPYTPKLGALNKGVNVIPHAFTLGNLMSFMFQSGTLYAFEDPILRRIHAQMGAEVGKVEHMFYALKGKFDPKREGHL